MSTLIEFIDYTTFSVNYDVMGTVTATFVVLRNTYGMPSSKFLSTVAMSNVTLTGYVTSITINPIAKSAGWVECTISMIAIAT